jgi:hypothetical protein
MSALFRTFFYVFVLLLVCRIGAEVQTANDPLYTLEQSAETGAEEDSKELEDDDLAGNNLPLFFSVVESSVPVWHFPLDFSGPILEVVPPPPLA